MVRSAPRMQPNPEGCWYCNSVSWLKTRQSHRNLARTRLTPQRQQGVQNTIHHHHHAVHQQRGSLVGVDSDSAATAAACARAPSTPSGCTCVHSTASRTARLKTSGSACLQSRC